jgi:flagellar biosynthesis anti-sigma factor FlgM
MKIEGNHGQPDCTPVRLNPQGADRTKEKAVAPQLGPDRVNLSTDVGLVNSAMRAATDAPEIRQDAVERARQKLAAGEVGQDLVRLADRLIDHVVSNG